MAVHLNQSLSAVVTWTFGLSAAFKSAQDHRHTELRNCAASFYVCTFCVFQPQPPQQQPPRGAPQAQPSVQPPAEAQPPLAGGNQQGGPLDMTADQDTAAMFAKAFSEMPEVGGGGGRGEMQKPECELASNYGLRCFVICLCKECRATLVTYASLTSGRLCN